MSDRLCPYPGLRPFSEDEAIFFQGREENVSTIASVLEQNRFLMLAGSSGDGKSSLVFAGLVPHCRAGFFRAAYPGWAVAVFRPERSPLERLACAVAEALGLEAGPVESSLRHGFSALVDLYMSSPAVGGYEDDATGKPALAVSQNLLIVADQFEELFTNPENFVANAPTSEARLCVNLLLETARLAQANDLPIYVVCTMRSDYIGQCNAFTGLPEMIGHSHYFVPRLTRAQLRRVVLEPARLNGDAIAPRLAERLIYDLQEGEDQLPLLQHALSAIWRQADADGIDLDLLAYQRCGGMDAAELPDDQRLPTLPAPRVPADAHAYGLGAVLNRHAGKLFKQAVEAEADPDAARRLARAFTCLTGQDNGRMVRNRMSIAQIARTIEPDAAAWPALELALARMFAPFRSMAAGFVRPLREDYEPETLDARAVLDITHEALIRNWDSLKEWALAEHRRLTTWRELEPQVRRWAEAREAKSSYSDLLTRSMAWSTLIAGRGSTYLLAIGPLTYFERWEEDTAPTAEWILRYSSNEGPVQERSAKAAKDLALTQDFMNRSKRRLSLTREVARVGLGRMVGVGFLCGLAFGAATGAWRQYQSSNKLVAEKARDRAAELFASPLTDRATRSAYLLNAYAAGQREHADQWPGKALPALRGLVSRQETDSLRAATALDAAHAFLRFYTAHDHPAVRSLALYADSIARAGKPATRSARFFTDVRLHGYWKGLHFLSADKGDRDRADQALERVRKELPYFLAHATAVDAKVLATAVVYDAFADLTDTRRIQAWLDRVDGKGSGAADSAVQALFNPDELENQHLIACGRFLTGSLDYRTGIQHTFVVGEREHMEAVIDPVKFYLCQLSHQSPVTARFEAEMLQNFQKSGASEVELSRELYAVLLMTDDPAQLLTPSPFPMGATWTDLFADPGQALRPSLLTTGTHKSFLFNTELLINSTLGRMCQGADAAGCELALGRFLFQYAAPYDLAQARRYLAEGLKSVPPGTPPARLASALSDSGIAAAYVPAYRVLVKQLLPQAAPATRPITGPLNAAATVLSLNGADQTRYDSLTAQLSYNDFASPAALWLARWANPATRRLSQGLSSLKPDVRRQLIAAGRTSLLVADSALPAPLTRQDSLDGLADLYVIQNLLAHRKDDLPDYDAQHTTGGNYARASAALVPYLVVSKEAFAKTARQAVARRQIGDENTGALHTQMVDLYALSGRYWPAYRELENVYSSSRELYFLNTLLFDDLDLRHAERSPSQQFYYRKYLLAHTTVGGYR